MLSDAHFVPGTAAVKISEHEDAAHEKRNWVRLTFDCNNHCVFCLDTLTHDGVMRDRDDVKEQILDGKRKGAERLILSGGEPTMHPSYVDFIKLGRLAGYKKVQTVTNGRLFSYPEFMKKCLDAGLDEITFSVHGPNARIHDALVGVKGAFEQEVRAIEMALADGRPIVNIDIVINRANVKHLTEMLDKFIAIGVREYDLLQVIPFGNAFTEGRDILFYDLAELRPYLVAAFEYSKRPDIHIWLNRFPVQHLEGFESLIQDPYKLNDEVRGRKEEFARMLYQGEDLDCRDPNRCRYCYLEQLCDTLYGIREQVSTRKFDVLRIDTEWEAKQEAVFGGDPASAKRALVGDAQPQRRHSLPVCGADKVPRYAPPPVLANEAGATTLVVHAATVERALEALAVHTAAPDVELQLQSYDGLSDALSDDRLGAKTLRRATAHTVADAQRLLAIPAAFEVQVALDRDTATWLLGLEDVSSRLSLYQPTYQLMSEAAAKDCDLRAFFASFRHPVPVEGVPACVTGRAPRSPRAEVDTAMMTSDGRLEIFRYAKRFILEHYRTKSLRCEPCVHEKSCSGMHVNHVRAHGYGLMQPVVTEC